MPTKSGHSRGWLLLSYNGLSRALPLHIRNPFLASVSSQSADEGSPFSRLASTSQEQSSSSSTSRNTWSLLAIQQPDLGQDERRPFGLVPLIGRYRFVLLLGIRGPEESTPIAWKSRFIIQSRYAHNFVNLPNKYLATDRADERFLNLLLANYPKKSSLAINRDSFENKSSCIGQLIILLAAKRSEVTNFWHFCHRSLYFVIQFETNRFSFLRRAGVVLWKVQLVIMF